MDPDIEEHKTPLGRLTRILYNNPNVTVDRLVEALQNATTTAVQLNDTLSQLGVLDIDAVCPPPISRLPHLTMFRIRSVCFGTGPLHVCAVICTTDVMQLVVGGGSLSCFAFFLQLSNSTGLPLEQLDDLNSRLANITLPTVERVQNATNSTRVPGSIEEWGDVNQTELRDTIDEVCDALQSTDGQAVLEALGDSNGTLGDLANGNTSSLTDDDAVAGGGLPRIVLDAIDRSLNATNNTGALDPERINSATDTSGELLRQLAGLDAFREEYGSFVTLGVFPNAILAWLISKRADARLPRGICSSSCRLHCNIGLLFVLGLSR